MYVVTLYHTLCSITGDRLIVLSLLASNCIEMATTVVILFGLALYVVNLTGDSLRYQFLVCLVFLVKVK